MSETRHYGPGSDNGGRHWAIVATLIQTAKLNDVDPLAWLTDVLQRIVAGTTKTHELHTLLPWNWKAAKAVEVPNSAWRTRRFIRRGQNHRPNRIRYTVAHRDSARSQDRPHKQCGAGATLTI